jgi:hypothetical protein
VTPPSCVQRQRRPATQNAPDILATLGGGARAAAIGRCVIIKLFTPSDSDSLALRLMRAMFVPRGMLSTATTHQRLSTLVRAYVLVALFIYNARSHADGALRRQQSANSLPM